MSKFLPGERSKKQKDLLLGEDAPVNSAGAGNIAGIGVGSHGEPPGISKMKKLWRRYLKGTNK